MAQLLEARHFFQKLRNDKAINRCLELRWDYSNRSEVALYLSRRTNRHVPCFAEVLNARVSLDADATKRRRPMGSGTPVGSCHASLAYGCSAHSQAMFEGFKELGVLNLN